MIRSKNSFLNGILKNKNLERVYKPEPKKIAKMKPKFLLILSLMALLASCVKKPGSYPPEPQIYHLSTRPNAINLNDTVNAVKIELKFTDGDGDIGRDESLATMGVFLRDSRDTSTDKDYTFRYPFPYISDQMRPDDGGLEGFITISLDKRYFSISDSLHLALRKDTLTWKIYIQDDAGHKSNVVSSEPIYLSF
jgi:hypothetical protein